MEVLHNKECAARSHAWLQAAANLYIPRSAGRDEASKWDASKAGTTPVSAPASGAEIDMASPFKNMKIAGNAQKPDKAPHEVCGLLSTICPCLDGSQRGKKQVPPWQCMDSNPRAA